VLLDAPDEVLLSRMGNGQHRPLLGDEPASALPRLRALRKHAYAAAHLRVAAEPPVAQVADGIVGAVTRAVRVAAPSRAYSVEIRAGALDHIAQHVPADATAVALIADRAVTGFADRVVATLESSGLKVARIDVDGGEPLKTWESAGHLLGRLSEAGLRRDGCIIALGGGTVGDVAGFVAATYLRGVAWINVPTTLLAMVDSAVGGKTGVNLAHGKNLAGAFWQPRAVVCDPALLQDLPERSFRSAFGEIVKCAMISDRGLVQVIDRDLPRLLARDPDALSQVVARCVAIKADVVAADERDSGIRAILNYGHTVGHALEAAAGFSQDITHGEAVAVGMRVAGLLSRRLLRCPRSDIEWQDAVLQRCGLDRTPAVDRSALLGALSRDKKSTGGAIGWVLLARRGDPRFAQLVPDSDLESALTEVLAA
jgi:3-dehydroquinate synthase